MYKRISEEVRAEIQRLYKDGNGITPIEIARQTGVKYDTVYRQTRGIEKIRKNGFKSLHEYQKHLARKRVNPETGELFKSRTEYFEYLARKNGFKSLHEYQKHLVRKRVNPETGEPFESLYKYQEHLARQRSEKKENIEFGNLVRTRLRDLDKTKSWLAEQLEVSSSAVSFYANGRSRPRGENLNRLLLTLEIKDLPKGLENLVH